MQLDVQGLRHHQLKVSSPWCGPGVRDGQADSTFRHQKISLRLQLDFLRESNACNATEPPLLINAVPVAQRLMHDVEAGERQPDPQHRETMFKLMEPATPVTGIFMGL